jgi:hypothetical protein
MTLTRRTLLQLAGLAALPALVHADEATITRWTDALLQRGLQDPPRFFTPEERALVRSIADGILPRTDTPGALDVGVPAFVEIIVGEWMEPTERDAFRAGLAALDQRALAMYGARWPALDPIQRDGELQWGESTVDTATEAKRTYRRLKGLVLHGYLTSEVVRRDVLKVNYIHETFRGCVPVTAPAPAARRTGGMSHA